MDLNFFFTRIRPLNDTTIPLTNMSKAPVDDLKNARMESDKTRIDENIQFTAETDTYDFVIVSLIFGLPGYIHCKSRILFHVLKGISDESWCFYYSNI